MRRWSAGSSELEGGRYSHSCQPRRERHSTPHERAGGRRGRGLLGAGAAGSAGRSGDRVVGGVTRGMVPGKGWRHLAPVTTVPATHVRACYACREVVAGTEAPLREVPPAFSSPPLRGGRTTALAVRRAGTRPAAHARQQQDPSLIEGPDTVSRPCAVPRIPATLQWADGLELRLRVVRDRGPYPKPANDCLRPANSGAHPAGEAAWPRALEKADGNCNYPAGRWINS